MKKEQFFRLLGELDDQVLEQYRQMDAQLSKKMLRKKRPWRVVIIAACLVLLMGACVPVGMMIAQFENDPATPPRSINLESLEELEIMRTGQPITNRIHKESWKGGHSSWCRLSKFPWYAADGTVKGIVGISSDVTELIETQQRYRRMAEQLNQRNQALEKEISLARQIQFALQSQRIAPREWKDEENGKKQKAYTYARLHH